MYSPKTQKKKVELFQHSPLPRANHFQRKNNNKSQRTSPSRSDSASLSKFFVKDVKSRINDPQEISKTIFDKIQFQKCSITNRNDYFTQIKAEITQTSRIPKTPPSKFSIKDLQEGDRKRSNLIIEQENNNYKQLYQKQSKQFKQFARQIVTLKLKNKNLQQNNDKLIILNQKFQKKIGQLQAQLVSFSSFRSSSSTEQNDQHENYANPIKKLKHNKFITVTKFSKDQRQSVEKISKMQIQITKLKTANQTLLKKQCQQCKKNKMIEQQFQRVQKQLFAAKQQIKKLNLQIDCVRRKAYNDLENQKISKISQYTILKKRFLDLLNDYTQLKKATRKQEISNKVKNAVLSKNSLKMIGSNSSQELNSILQISVSSQQV